jgi:hypothetical protein
MANVPLKVIKVSSQSGATREEVMPLHKATLAP